MSEEGSVDEELVFPLTPPNTLASGLEFGGGRLEEEKGKKEVGRGPEEQLILTQVRGGSKIKP